MNPFAVKTPEDIKAEDALFLFVDVFTDFYKILGTGHTFVHGPRGCGKSMMFRYMLPDCQLLVNKEQGKEGLLSELNYFAVYIPIKLTDPHVTELDRLENRHANLILNEHWITVTILEKLFSSFGELVCQQSKDISPSELKDFYTDVFTVMLSDMGWSEELPAIAPNENIKSICLKMSRLAGRLFRTFNSYIRDLARSDKPIIYDGLICGYLDFFLPLVRSMKQLSFMPNVPIFLLFDDADNLSETQKTILNTWVSYRTGSDISIKASTQLKQFNKIILVFWHESLKFVSCALFNYPNPKLRPCRKVTKTVRSFSFAIAAFA